MTATVRRAKPSDSTWLADCTKAAYAVYIPVLGREPLLMTINYEKAIHEFEIWIAESNSQPVGLLMLENRTDHLVIYSVAVMPTFTGKEIGKFLLNHAEKVATDYGHQLVRLYTNELMKRNLAIYRKFGYVVSHTECYQGLDVIHLIKPL